MERKRNRNALRSQRMIQEALLSLMQESDLDRISISDIVRRADVNRGTFYAHYNNIPEVLEHIVDDQIRRFDEYLKEQRIRWTAGNALTIMSRFIQSMDSDFLTTLRRISAKKQHSAVLDRMQKYIREQLLSCMELPEDPRQREDFLIRMTFFGGGVTGLLEEILSGGLSVPVSSVEESLKDIISRFEPAG